MKPCPKLYESIATRKLPSRMVYENFAHGVMALLDIMPAAEGHIGVASLVCERSIDALQSSVLRNKLYTVATFAGRALELVYPDAPYVGELAAHNQIPHPHLHRMPGDDKADWAKRFGRLDDWPRLKLSTDHMDDIQSRLTTPDDLQELWQACDAEVAALGAPDAGTVAAIKELGIVLPR